MKKKPKADVENKYQGIEAALQRKLSEFASSTDQKESMRIEPVADPLDQIISSADRELAITRLEGDTKLILDIRSALVKLRDGEYGICEECEEPIPDKRLQALPWARLCIQCQQKAESQHREAA